jgi:hypothetical protein
VYPNTLADRFESHYLYSYSNPEIIYGRGFSQKFRRPQPRITDSKKVTEKSLLSAFKGMEGSAVKGKREGQNSVGLRTDHDVYEVRPRKDRDGVDLISDRFRNGPIGYEGPDAVRNAVAYAKCCSWSRSHRVAESGVAIL